MFKRSVDISVAILLLLVLLPVFLAIALFIKLDSKGPVFFRQLRVGKNRTEFNMLKFRSMVINAPDIGPYYTSKNDVRITPSGSLLRKTSLDELPQLINVLKGDMSLVGPRPDVLAQQKEYSETDWQKRHSIRPGITGLAQASMRSAASAVERCELDLDYVDRGSWTLDLKILLLTAKQVVFKGSY